MFQEPYFFFKLNTIEFFKCNSRFNSNIFKIFFHYNFTISSLWIISDLLEYPKTFSIWSLLSPFTLIISSEEKDVSPLAQSLPFSSTIKIFSPFKNWPSTLIIPAGKRLFPFLSALEAPLSICIFPLDLVSLNPFF